MCHYTRWILKQNIRYNFPSIIIKEYIITMLHLSVSATYGLSPYSETDYFFVLLLP